MDTAGAVIQVPTLSFGCLLSQRPSCSSLDTKGGGFLLIGGSGWVKCRKDQPFHQTSPVTLRPSPPSHAGCSPDFQGELIVKYIQSLVCGACPVPGLLVPVGTAPDWRDRALSSRS